jgi:hypothetical protein
MAIIQVTDETAEALRKVCEKRQVDADTAIGFMSRSFVKEPHLYGPMDTLEFGKYYGEQFLDVMHMDPGYVAWMHNTATGVGLTDEAITMFNSLYHNKKRPKQPLFIHPHNLDDDLPAFGTGD